MNRIPASLMNSVKEIVLKINSEKYGFHGGVYSSALMAIWSYLASFLYR